MKPIINVLNDFTGEREPETYTDLDQLFDRITGLMSPGCACRPGFEIELVETDSEAVLAHWEGLLGVHGPCDCFGPSNPWDAPGMSVTDFVYGCVAF